MKIKSVNLINFYKQTAKGQCYQVSTREKSPLMYQADTKCDGKTEKREMLTQSTQN